MPHRRKLELSEEQKQELIQYRDHDPRPYVRERSSALLRIAMGQSPHAVAQDGVVKPRDPDTVYKWISDYEAEGIAGVVGHQQGGNQRGHL